MYLLSKQSPHLEHMYTTCWTNSKTKSKTNSKTGQNCLSIAYLQGKPRHCNFFYFFPSICVMLKCVGCQCFVHCNALHRTATKCNTLQQHIWTVCCGVAVIGRFHVSFSKDVSFSKVFRERTSLEKEPPKMSLSPNSCLFLQRDIFWRKRQLCLWRKSLITIGLLFDTRSQETCHFVELTSCIHPILDCLVLLSVRAFTRTRTHTNLHTHIIVTIGLLSNVLSQSFCRGDQN